MLPPNILVFLDLVALAAIPRGTLHVMLTKPGETGLVLSKDAEAEREAGAAAVTRFQESTTGESLVSADPRATAAAVNAQVCAVQTSLLNAGAITSPTPGIALHCATSKSDQSYVAGKRLSLLRMPERLLITKTCS